MRTTLITFLAVLALFEIGLRVVEHRVPSALSWENQFTQDKAEQIREFGSIDLVVIGSSVANASIDARVLANGRVGYNAALPAYTPRVWAEWFDDVVAPARPGTVVIALDVRQYSDNKPGTGNQVRRYLESEGRHRYMTGETPSLAERTGDVLAITRLRSRLREPDKFFAALTGIGELGDWQTTALDAWGRYVRFDDNVFSDDQESLDRIANRAFLDFAVGGSEEDAVRRIIESSRAIGADVVLVMTPSVRAKLATALPSGIDDMEIYEAGLRDLAESEGVPLLTYEDLNGREDLFADYYHMNAEGSVLLSSRLADDIAAILAEEPPA